MKHLNLNIPIAIFIAGAILYMFAPFELFDSYTTHDIFMTGLLIELFGITAGLIVFARYKITEKLMKEI